MIQPIDFIELMIIISVIVCASVNILAAIIIYRRDPHSREHQFFMVFLLGIAGFVLFYLFLQSPILSEYCYFFQIISVNTALVGLTHFYYALSHEGHISLKFTLTFSTGITLLPIICLIFHPYSVFPINNRFEFIVEPWFMVIADSVYMITGTLVFIGLILIIQKSNNQALKRKIFLIFYGLLTTIISGLIFYVILSGFFYIHALKPIGYLGMAIGSLIMAYAFKGKKSKPEPPPEKMISFEK